MHCQFLHNIADGTPNIDDIEAISREDKYLKYIALNGGTSGGNASQEVGEWSPTLVNYTDLAHPNTVVDPTYSVVYSNAYYLKMGKLVHISFRIKVEITDIGTGFGCVAGLPFNPDPNMLGQAFTIAENSAVTESEGVIYDGVVGQLYPDIYLETYNERHIPAISLRTDNGIQAKTFKVGTNWISYSGCYVCDDPYVPPQDSLVTIEHGGTSGKTADEARNNLNVYSKEEIDGKIPDINVVQETGTSETAVMSQKAVTDAIPTKLTDLSGTLPINQGGTGATNAKDAITNLGGVPIYTGVTSFISLPATTAEVIQAMPYPSILMTWIDTTSNSITDLPCNYGILTIHKRSDTRLQILYNRSHEGDINGNNFYFGNYNTLAKTVTWNKIFTSYSGCQVPIENGGTGASTSKQALINLGIPEIPSAGTYILQVSDGVLSWVQS